MTEEIKTELGKLATWEIAEVLKSVLEDRISKDYFDNEYVIENRNYDEDALKLYLIVKDM